MNAQNARELAFGSVMTEMRKIRDKIKQSCLNGQMYIVVDDLSQAAEASLINDGYTVIKDVLIEGTFYTISW